MIKILPLAAILSILLFSCDMGPSLDRPAHEVTGPGFRIIHLGENRRSAFTIDLSLDRASDVFVVFTNPTDSSQTLPELRVSPETAFQSLRLNALSSWENTRVAHSLSGTGTLSATTSDAVSADTRAPVHRGNARIGVPGLREVDPAWFEDSGDAAEADATSEPEDVLRSSGLEASEYEAGETAETLWRLLNADPLDFEPVEATVRYFDEPLSGFRLVIWVENDLWDGNGGSGNIQQDMVDTLGDALTKTESGTSVFQTLTNTFGQPWGETAVSGVLPEHTETVHVFLADIAEVGSNLGNGFVAGYFFARDVFLNSSTTSSLPGNEKLMVYVHGPAFATGAGAGTWELTDFWPSEMALTTAHELQHLINYYQSTVRTGRKRTDVWLDELMSVLSEELIAERFRQFSELEALPDADSSFLGPRGVPPGVRRPIDTVEAVGRLVDFVLVPDRALTVWGGAVQYDYAASYAFGTWLVRNFGGVGLLPRIHESTSTGTRAVEDAVRWHTGESLTFGELLERWAAANVLSDRNIPARSYRLTASAWFDSEPGAGDTSVSEQIRLGDIPFRQYRQAVDGGETGLFTFPPNNSSIVSQLHGSSHAPHSNLYYQAAAGHTGPITLDITGARAGRATIVILEDQ